MIAELTDFGAWFMQISQFHYLPLTPIFFSFLIGIFFILLIVVELRLLRYAYLSLGLSPRGALMLLLATLVGSFFNIPVAQLPPERMVSNRVVDFFGMQYAVPLVDLSQPVIAVNIGGAVIPTLMSIYLLARLNLWGKGLLATAIVALIIHWLANPVPGLGIAVPVFEPAIITAIVALVLSRRDAAPLAYIAGGLGTLIGADITNLDKVRGLGAPIASIGGAGTFDGIFLTGIMAVLLASLVSRPRMAASS